MPAAAIPDTLCHLNGEFLPLCDARVSVLDRGFIFGDGVYEVIPVYDRRPFAFAAHIARLGRSLDELRIPHPHDEAGWRAICERLLQAAPAAPSQALYLQVTRGVAPREHPMLPGLTPTVFVMVNPMKPVPAPEREAGAVCVSADDFRWQRAHIKATSLLGGVMARQISVDAGATETLLFRGEQLSEASTSNVWLVRGGCVSGPVPDHLLLRGIRFGLLEQLCADAGIPFALRNITRDEVLAADELLLSSSSKEVLAITRLDGRPVGKGEPGPMYHRLYAAYQQAKREQRF